MVCFVPQGKLIKRNKEIEKELFLCDRQQEKIKKNESVNYHYLVALFHIVFSHN